MGWERELAAIENSLRNLNAQYDAFLYGSSHKPPLEIRRRLGQQIRRMSTAESDSSADRFRFSALQVRYNALCERWDRLQSEKEAGRRPGIYGHFVRLGDSGETRVRREDTGSRPPEGLAESPNARAAASVDKVDGNAAPPGREPERDLFERYVEARRTRGEEVAGLRFDRFVEKLAEQREKLKENFGDAEILFDVAERDGKIRLVARPKKA